MRVVLADYGAGNLRSVCSALRRAGAEPHVSIDPEEVRAAPLAVIAGVGHVESAARGLAETGLDAALRDRVAAAAPVLGICVGMQLLFEESEEGGSGLGVLAGQVLRVHAARVPHMGWNTLCATRPSALLDGLDGADVYFAHSFAVAPAGGDVAVATVDHGGAIVAAVESGPVAGVQFHPERSAAAGARMLENALRWSAHFGSTLRHRDAMGTRGARTQGVRPSGSDGSTPRSEGSSKRRVICCLDVAGGRVVKGVNFVGLRDVGDPVELANRYSELGADELVFLDITATVERRAPMLELIERSAEELTIPFTVGGGVTGLEDARSVLRAGADKVAVNRAAFDEPAILTALADEYGAQAVVCAIDARRSNGAFEVVTHGGRKPRDRDAVDWAREAVGRGAGEIMLTSIDADGTRAGYDLELTAAVADAVEVPVIASGGAGNAGHMAGAFEAGAEAALIASIVHERPERLPELKAELEGVGWAIRS